MESEGQQTQICENCKKMINIDKIDLHEAFCAKNTEKCNLCGEFIEKGTLEDHTAESHKKCKFCNIMVIDIHQLSLHEPNCYKNGIHCNLCQVSFQKEKLADHIEHCSAKSDTCLQCFKMILRKDFQNHTQKCIGENKNEFLPLLNRTVSNNQIYAQKKIFETLSDIEIVDQINIQILSLQEQANISEGKAIEYLCASKWDFEKAYNKAIQNYNPSQQKHKDSDKNNNVCLICLKVCEKNEELYSLNCNHLACNECYAQYVQSQFFYGEQMLFSPCIIQGCLEIVGQKTFQRFLKEDKYLKYLQHLQNNAVQHSLYLIACPKKLCSLILQSVKSNFDIKQKLFNIMCPNCETYFCNYCKEECHKPIQCEQYLQFKNQSQDQNSNEYKQYQLSMQAFQVFAKNRKQMLQNFNSTKSYDPYFQETYEYALNLTIECLIIRGWTYAMIVLFQKQKENQNQSEYEINKYTEIQKELDNFKQTQSQLSQQFKVFQQNPEQKTADELRKLTKQVEQWLSGIVQLIEQKQPGQEQQQQNNEMLQNCIQCENKYDNEQNYNEWNMCQDCYQNNIQ